MTTLTTSVRATFLLALAGLLVTGCTSPNTTAAQTAATRGIRNPPTTLPANSFSAGQVVGAGTTHDTDVAIDPATGRVYVAWALDLPKLKPKDSFFPQDLYVASSLDNGKTFSKPVRVNHTTGQVTAGFNTRPKLAITGPSMVVATFPYMSQDMSTMATKVTHSTDSGLTWAPEKDASAKDGGKLSDLYQGIAVSGKDVYIGFNDYRKAKNPSMAQGISVVHSGDRGKTYGETSHAELTTCACCENALAADSKGTVFFAYRNLDQVSKNITVRDTAMIRSYDKGKTWSDPVLMSDDHWAYNGCPESGPELRVDAKNTVHGIYYTGKPGGQGIFYTASPDGGSSFKKPVVVVTDKFFPPANMGLAIDDKSSTWIVWDDKRTKDKRVWLALASGGKVQTLAKPVAHGETPSIDSTGGLTIMAWSEKNGTHVATRGTYTAPKPNTAAK
jgi:hypothetical protein